MLMTGVMERCCAIDEEYYLGDYYDYDNDYDYSGPNPGKKIYKFTNFPYCILIFLCGQVFYVARLGIDLFYYDVRDLMETLI